MKHDKCFFTTLISVFVVALLVISIAGCTSSPTVSPSPSATTTSLFLENKDISIPVDNDSSVTATLTTGGNAAPTGKTVQWFVNGQSEGNSSTDYSGMAVLPLKPLTNVLALGRNYTVQAEFKGDSTLLPSNDTGTLTTFMYSSVYESTVYNQTVGLVQSGNFPSLPNTTRFTGTYMTFDLSQKTPDVSTYRGSVPYSVYNASSTVFFVKTTQLERVGQYYSESGPPRPISEPITGTPGAIGYRAQFDIYVVKYPEKTPIGKYTIISEPPNTRTPVSTDQIGNPAEWQTWISQHTENAFSGGV